MAIEGGVACNCSICHKAGTVLTFTPASGFTLRAGEGALVDYQFGKKVIHHLFCGRCGVRCFARGAMPDGAPVVAVNVRCLDDVDLASVPTTHYYDGKSIPLDG